MVPVFLLILAGAIEFGRVFWTYGILIQAVQEGARMGAVLPYATNDTAIATRVQQVAAAGSVSVNTSAVTISATCSYTSNTAVTAANRTRGNVLTVSLRYTYSPLLPFLPLGAISLAPNASMELEQGPPSACT